MKLLESKYGLYHHASKSFQSYFKDMFSLQTKSYQCNGKFYNRICLWSGNVPFCPECYWRLGYQYKQGNFFDLPCLQWDVHWSYERLTIRQHFILVNWYVFCMRDCLVAYLFLIIEQDTRRNTIYRQKQQYLKICPLEQQHTHREVMTEKYQLFCLCKLTFDWSVIQFLTYQCTVLTETYFWKHIWQCSVQHFLVEITKKYRTPEKILTEKSIAK